LPADLQHDLQDYAERLTADPQHGREELLGRLNFPEQDVLAAWLATQREALTQTRVRVLSRNAKTHAEAGRLTAALECTQAWLHHTPLDEEAHRVRVRLLYQQGNRAAALAAYEQCEQRLRTELGVEPSAATRMLWAQLQQTDQLERGGPPAIPLALLRPPRLVARGLAWQAMLDIVASPGVLVLEGEAGMGKSRLLGDFVASQAGWCGLAAQPGDDALPLSLLARLLSEGIARWGRPAEDWVCRELARLAPEAGAPATDPFAVLRLRQAVRAALLDWHRQGLAGLAVDDLHHADGATLHLLLPLFVQTAADGLPWLLASRPPLEATGLQELRRHALSSLGLDDMQALLASLDVPGLAGLQDQGWAAALLQRTGGNPLFVLQTLAAVFEQGGLQQAEPAQALAVLPSTLPSTLQAALAGRMERLTPQARAIVRVACVASADFTPQLACQLLGVPPAALADPWLELQAAQIMRGSRFAHDLVRDAALAITPGDLRGLIHAQVAQALAEAKAPPARIAEHWDAAGRWSEAATAFEEAAAQARACGTPADELLKLKAATRCHRATATAAGLAAAFVTEARALGLSITQTQLGDDVLQACQSLLAAACNDEQRARAQVLLGHFWSERFEPETGLEAAQAGLQLACASHNVALELEAAQRLAGLLGRLGRYEEALQILRPRQGDLHRLTLDDRLAWLADFGLALDYADQRQEAVAVFDQVAVESQAQQRWAVAASALSSKSVALMYLGRLQGSLDAIELSLALSRRVGLEGEGLLIDEATWAGNLRDLGQFSTYLQRAERLPQALRDAGSLFWAANTEHDLATAYAWLGRPDLAWRTLSSPIEDLPPLMRAARLHTRARLARDYGVGVSGPTPQAMQAQALQWLDEAQAPGRSHFRLAISLYAARDDSSLQSLQVVCDLEAEGRRRQNFMFATAASCVHLHLLLQRGERRTACGVARALLERMAGNEMLAGLYVGELWWLLYQGLERHEPDLAKSVLSRAVQWVENTAREQVPALYQASFLARNPFNAALLGAAAAQAVQ
jgi:tetratricopeptide (TPR) repeat protein